MITNDNINEVIEEVQQWMVDNWSDEELNHFFTSGFGEHELVNYNSGLGYYIRERYGLWKSKDNLKKSTYPIFISSIIINKIWKKGPRQIYERRQRKSN